MTVSEIFATWLSSLDGISNLLHMRIRKESGWPQAGRIDILKLFFLCRTSVQSAGEL